MVIGIVVPHDTLKGLHKTVFKELADYQAAVGGYIETVTVADHPLMIMANEEGKLQRLPINLRATLLWWLLNPEGLGGDAVVGDVVVVGPIENGEFTDAHHRLQSLLLEHDSL